MFPKAKPRTLLSILVVSLGAFIVAITTFSVVNDRGIVLARERDNISRICDLVSLNTGATLRQTDFFFRAADLWLASHPGADPRFDKDFNAFVDQFRKSTGSLVDIHLVTGDGKLFYLPSGSATALADVSDRAYFQAQSNPDTRGFFFGEPVKSRVTNQWGLPISSPLPHGGECTVIFSCIELRNLLARYESVRPKPRGTVVLSLTNGTLLISAPLEENLIGKNLDPTGKWPRLLSSSPSGVGTFDMKETDGVERLMAYRVLDGYPLVVAVTNSTSDLLSSWLSMTVMRVALAALMIAVLIFLAGSMARTFRTLEATKVQLEASSRKYADEASSKERLFSVLSHDLRGPVGGLCNFLDTLAENISSMSPTEVDEALSALRQSSRNTWYLLENLLAWSRFQRGQTRFSPGLAEFAPLAKECLALFAINARQKGISLTDEVEPRMLVYCDDDILRTILRNLLSNAVKFSSRNGHIVVAGKPEDGWSVISVSDDGIGMDDATQARIFLSETSGSRVGTDMEKGTGLGLVLVREFVQLHGGLLSIESAPGKGSRFILKFPPPPRE